MGIHLNVASNLRPLAKKMAEDLENKQSDSFTPSWIITQTDGMNSWLRIELARQMGIAANIRFHKPNDLVSKVHFLFDQGKHTVLDAETLQWTIYALLEEPEFQHRFPDIAAYYQDNTIRQIAFASELADIFDQYQVYRSELISLWNQGNDAGMEGEDWQKWLWTKAKEKLRDGYIDKSDIEQDILKQLSENDGTNRISKRIPSLHFFGIAVITPYYLRIFHAMSKFIDIHFYLINPAPHDFWLHDQSEKKIAALYKQRKLQEYVRAGNDMLHNWGRIMKESFQLLFQVDDFVNSYEVVSSPIGNSRSSSLLHKLQQDITENTDATSRSPLDESAIHDGSITINGCFTPLREVETFYNYLVEMVENSPKESISPRDILVLVTDIDLYAPYIKAVFRHAPYRFPFTIADETITAENNMFTALQDILTLDAQYFKAEEVLKLLESPYIRKRFQISDVEAVRTTVRQAGIYYSMEGRLDDDTRYISWEYGLKKVLYGICMSGDQEMTEGGDAFIPLDTAEGASAVERIRLIHFISLLKDKLLERKRYRSIAEWADYLTDVMEELIFESGEQEDNDYGKFVELLEKLVALNATANIHVSFEVFRHSFLHKLQQESRASSFAGAGITFCSMVPMRSIPFNVVALLGMNVNKFPRKDTPLSFSLLTRERKPGDRNVKDNDKHLFLETILSAEEKLYISFIARDAKNGAELPPSPLVDECIDYVARGLKKDTEELRKEWITVHPLHGFSSRYFSDSKLRNYLSEKRYLTGIDVGEKLSKEPKSFDFTVIDLNDFAEFFRNPPKVYLNKQFEVYYRDEEILIPDHEVFELDYLEKYKVQMALMLPDQADVDTYIEANRRSGKIPLRNMAAATVGAAFEEGKELRQLIKDEIGDREPEMKKISLKIENTNIIGELRLYGDKFIGICNSSKRLSYLVAYYVRYLALTASGTEASFVFIDKNKKASSIAAGTITKQQAENLLLQLLADYCFGHQAYFIFWPAAANDDFSQVKKEWAEFCDHVEDLLDSDFNTTFRDDYLKKSIEHGFFSENNFPILRENLSRILKPIQALMPNPFKK